MASFMDPELERVIRQICRSEMQAELQSLRAEVLRLKRRLNEVSTENSDPFFEGRRGCMLPWDCLDKKSPRNMSIPRSSKDTETDSLVGADIDDVSVRVMDSARDVEDASNEFRDIVRHAKVEVDLKPDIWGATLFVIVKDFADVAMGEVRLENMLRMGMILFCFALNLSLQVMFLYWMAVLVMLPRVRELQDVYKLFHSVAFDSTGNFDTNAFNSLGEDLHKICGMAMSTSVFLGACLLLWVARCSNEFRAIHRRKRALDQLPDLPHGVAATHMVHELSLQVGDFLKEEKNIIVCLNTATRFWLNVLIFVPRCIVATFLLFLGTAFLTASKSFDDMILNSLAMAFVLDIDELLFNVFLPARISKNLQHTKIVTPTEEDLLHLKGQELDFAITKRVYMKSICVTILVLAFLIIWFVFQPILPGYEFDVSAHCKTWIEADRKLPCKFGDRNCFPK